MKAFYKLIKKTMNFNSEHSHLGVKNDFFHT